MKELVRELLGFSRGTSVETTADLSALVRRVAEVQRLTAGKHVDIETDLLFTGAVPCSAAKIEQILLNLIANAGYAMADVGGTIHVSCRREGAAAEIRVEDDGPGIPDDLLDDVFSPFVSTKPEGDGTGLGLAISRRLARSMGGDLEAANRDTGGARFTLSLPVEAPAPSAVVPAPRDAEVPVSPAR